MDSVASKMLGHVKRNPVSFQNHRTPKTRIRILSSALETDDVNLISKCFHREVHNKAVVGKENGLKAGTNIGERQQSSTSTRFIKSRENVIADEWDRLTFRCIIVEIG
jgi:hypothetical protein